ncbi:MAG: tetratricopeptide repeat protein, partial [Acidimicrobiia bacterium]
MIRAIPQIGHPVLRRSCEPVSADELSSPSLAHHKAGRPAEAVALYQATLEGNPGHTDALFNLGALLGAQGQFDEATGCYERVLELMPEDADTLSNLGNVMMA